jgi:NADH dehydrogenase
MEDMAEKTAEHPHRVVVIGSGFGGLFGTKALRNSDVQVTMIAKTTHHLFQPLLYQVATGILSEGEIAPPTREVLARQKNVTVLLGEVTDIDLTQRIVTSHVLGRELETPYDSLIVAAGAGQSYFGNDQFSTFAPGMKSIDDALELRGRIFGAFELAEVMAARGQDVDHLLTFVVVGAGPTGVEMAGQIAELAHKTLKRDFRSINTRKARVILLDAAPQVLPPFGAKLGSWTQKKLEQIGVEVQLGAMVVQVDERGLEVQDKSGERRRIDAVTKVWAAGVQASPLGKTLAEQTGAALDRAGRIAVNPDLTLPGHPEVFVVGDMVALDNLPGVAQVAIQGARYAAREIDGRLRGKAPQAGFKYFDKGSMATISRFSAVATVGKLRLSGFVAWLMWLGVHLFYITGF